MRGICTKRNWSDISIRGRDITFPPKALLLKQDKKENIGFSCSYLKFAMIIELHYLKKEIRTSFIKPHYVFFTYFHMCLYAFLKAFIRLRKVKRMPRRV